MKNAALCIGINYRGTQHELGGCVNDAMDWASFFRAQGFTARRLLEKEATASAIRDAIAALVSGLSPGCTGVVTFSGHGTWLPDMDGDEPDGRDEALVPVDAGTDGERLILDDELHEIFLRLPAESHLVFVSDCCHSGSVYRMFNVGRYSVRFLPPSHFVQNRSMLARVSHAFGLPSRRTVSRVIAPRVVHFSGCKDNEYSYDARFNARYNGAFTYYALRAFRQAVTPVDSTYHDVWKLIRQSLPSSAYPQTPQFTAATGMRTRRLFS